MKAKLEYASANDGPYKYVGTVRPLRGQLFTVVPVTEENRVGEPVIVGYQVTVEATTYTLNTDFLDSAQHYFRLKFESELEEIRFGQRTYTPSHDGLIEKRTYSQHLVRLSFFIDPDEYADYTDPVALPASEGGVVIEDSGFYIE